MKRTNLTQSETEQFIVLFIPDKSIAAKTATIELSHISSVIVDVLTNVNLLTSIDMVFKAFENQSYSISVVEPRREIKNAQPYIDTNSHAIYLGVDKKSIKKLSDLVLLFNSNLQNPSDIIYSLHNDVKSFAEKLRF